MLNLVFETPDRHVEPRGAHRFVVYAWGDVYPLPDVVLLTEQGSAPTVPLQEARISAVLDGRGDPSGLQVDIRSAWDAEPASGTDHVTARRELVVGRAVQVSRIDAVRSAPDAPVDLQVTWRFAYTDQMGVQIARPVTARLQFMPQNVAPPPKRLPLDAEAERLGVPATRRDIGPRAAFPYFAAVDFGTSASTVTVYDARRHTSWPIDPDQAHRLRTRVVDLLEQQPELLATPWSELLKRVSDAVTRQHKQYADLTAVLNRLRATSAGGAHDPLLDTVTWAIEQELGKAPQPLVSWLIPQLLACYDEAFGVPPIRQLDLFPVMLDPLSSEREVPTIVVVVDDDPVEIELGSPAPDAIRDVKSGLLKPKDLPGRRGQDGKDATYDDLIALVYHDLIQRTEKFLQREQEDRNEALDQLVVTFPTTTPPAVRLHLHRIIEHTLCITTPVTRYDEGVAAALYFLMRDFGGNRPEFGAEALRARSRRIATKPLTWRQNMLVIDVGAGTTDIAVLRLTLIDDTWPIPGCNPAVQGRYYVLQPQVINSTGHPQLGGNYLTLRVAYWIKAAIIDALIGAADTEARRRIAAIARQTLGQSDQELPSIAAKVVENGVEGPAPADVQPVLHRLLPTQGDAQAFQLLWDLAEAVKIKLGAAEAAGTYTVPTDNLQALLAAIDVKSADELLALLPPGGLELSAADFATLARPVLTHVVELAQWLVQQALRGQPAERLDRVVLSGKTSLMPLMQQVVAKHFAAGDRKQWSVANPAAIATEREYAKQAASIGASWAHANRNLTSTQEGEKDQLKMGRSVVNIDVENIFQALPCEFVLMRANQQQTPLLRAGTPLLEVDSLGTLAARVEWTDEEPWRALVPGFDVHRPTRPGKTQTWGTYSFEREAKLEGFTLNRGLWFTDASGSTGARIHAQLEIDENLVPHLHISQGRPHYHVQPRSSRELRNSLPTECYNATEYRLRALPAEVIVIGRPYEGHDDGAQVLFPIWAPDGSSRVSDFFPEYLHDHAGLDSADTPGRIATLKPAPMPNGDYEFRLRFPGGEEKHIHTEQVPARDGRTLRYTATLDVRGRLMIHRGYPPFWRATGLRDVEQHVGAVLRCDMQGGLPELEPSWDPFTGKH